MIAHLSEKQIHQVMHIAWPELYEAALQGNSVWVTLMHDGSRLTSKWFKVGLGVVIGENSGQLVFDFGQGVSWSMPYTLHSRPTVGVALTKRGPIVQEVDITGWLHLPVEKGGTLTLVSAKGAFSVG